MPGKSCPHTDVLRIAGTNLILAIYDRDDGDWATEVRWCRQCGVLQYRPCPPSEKPHEWVTLTPRDFGSTGT